MLFLKNFDLILLLKSLVFFFTHLIGVTTETEKDYLFSKYLLSAHYIWLNMIRFIMG